MAPSSRRPVVKRNGDGSTSEETRRGLQKEFEREAESHADRAARLLEKARAAAASNRTRNDTTLASHAAVTLMSKPEQNNARFSVASTSAEVPISLPTLLKSLVNPSLGTSSFTVKEAIPLAGKLVRAKLNTHTRLSHLNGPVLDDAGITGETDKHKILVAFGVRQVGQQPKTSASGSSNPALVTAQIALKRGSEAVESTRAANTPPKRRRAIDDESLSREYGNVVKPQVEPGLGGEQMEYEFNEVLDEESLKGRYVFVNRAPIMTAWTTLVLERLGFQRREALSISHCYVNTTSTARGISLGIIPASERERAVHIVGSNQPHFELMGVKIPLMKLSQTDEWRGISAGQVIGPDQAFNYMRRSMYQTLPLVIGALTLLADSYVNATSEDVKLESNALPAVREGADVASPDLLHARAYELYTQFRPETAGEWGKKSQFYCSKALALRRGHESDLRAWDANEDGEQLEAQRFEKELEEFVAAQQALGSTELRIGPDTQEHAEETIKTED